MIPDPLLSQIFEDYERYKETRLEDRYYRSDAVLQLVDELKRDPLFEVEPAGKSFEDREIYLIKVGKGKIKVFSWAQMHGDEPTANSALFDFINFLKNPGKFQKVRDDILENLTLWIMPLVNPDGAERFTRENAQGVDLNRDALALATPEAKILMSSFCKIEPDFAFNLHDQGRAHAAGKSGKPATISFLAPPPDDINSMPFNRQIAKLLISNLVDHLSGLIPGSIGRYSEEYEMRAFGDSFQGLGAATILIESGGYQSDIRRSFQRSLNFFLFIVAFRSIISREYQKYNTLLYDTLPENRKELYDLLIRNIMVDGEVVSIGINRIEKPAKSGRPVEIIGIVKRIGGLKNRKGYTEFDGSGLSTSKRISNGCRANFELLSGDAKAFGVVNGVLTQK
ncbi:M14 family metallopeptidase [Ignavibacteriales bacterium]